MQMNEIKIRKPRLIVWGLVVLILVLSGIILFTFASLSYEVTKNLVNTFPRDGELESFTIDVFQKIGWLRWLGGGLLVCGGLVIGFREKSIGFVDQVFTFVGRVRRQVGADFREMGSVVYRIYEDKWHLGLLVLIIGIAILTNAQFLSRPMRYDEAYTYNIYASKPYYQIISDYSLPNNHIFHSILVHFSTTIFGNQPWAVRLPAFIAGILIIPISYIVASGFFSRDIALLGAGFCAFFSILMDYATNARGYTLLCALTLVILGLSKFVINNRNRTAWWLIGGLAVLGFYTVPTMLYPFGAIGSWLLIVWVTKNYLKDYSSPLFIWHIFCLGILTGIGVVGVYAPVILVSGIQKLMGNNFVSALPWSELGPKNLQRLAQSWTIWHKGVSNLMMVTLTFGLVVGLFFDRKYTRQRISFPVVMIGFVVIAVIFQRVAPFDRMWLFAVPILLIWSAAGLFFFCDLIVRQVVGPSPKFLNILKVGLVFIFCGLLLIPARTYHLERSAGIGFGLKIANYILSNVSSEDVVVTTFPHDAPIRYYVDLNNPGEGDFFDFEKNSFQKVIVVYNSTADQSLEAVLNKQKFPVALLDFRTIELREQFGHLELYEITRR
jgi:uncharacterized membrane protein